MRLLWLPEVIRDAGLQVIEVDGWQDRGREFTRPIAGIVAHHTATPAAAKGDYPSLRVVRDGRPDLKGPLAQLGLGRSGVVYVIASGVANNAGAGSWPGIRGNSDTIGVEAEHPGGTAPWAGVQYDAYVRLCAALCGHLRLPVGRVIGHKEWAPGRKFDPTFDMGRFRGDIENALNETRRPTMYLPITQADAADRKSDVAAIAYLLNAAYGTKLPGDGTWPTEMSNVLRTRLGENGTFVTGKMYARLLVDVAKAQARSGALPARETVEIVRR